MALAGQGGNVVGAVVGSLYSFLSGSCQRARWQSKRSCRQRRALLGGILGYGAFYLLVGIALFTGIHSGVSPAVIGLGPVTIGGFLPGMGVAIRRLVSFQYHFGSP